MNHLFLYSVYSGYIFNPFPVVINTFFFRNSPSLDLFAIVDLFCVCPTFTLTATGDLVTSDVITKQWQLQCVDINKLYNSSCYDRKENISHCTYLYHCLSRSLCEKRLSCEKRMSLQRRMTAMRRTLRNRN